MEVQPAVSVASNVNFYTGSSHAGRDDSRLDWLRQRQQALTGRWLVCQVQRRRQPARPLQGRQQGRVHHPCRESLSNRRGGSMFACRSAYRPPCPRLELSVAGIVIVGRRCGSGWNFETLKGWTLNSVDNRWCKQGHVIFTTGACARSKPIDDRQQPSAYGNDGSRDSAVPSSNRQYNSTTNHHIRNHLLSMSLSWISSSSFRHSLSRWRSQRGCLSKRSWSFLKKSVALTCHYCPTIVESAVLVCFLLGGDLAAGLTTPRTGLVRVGPCWGNLRSRWREYSSFLLCKPLDQRWSFDSDEDWGLWRAHWVENYWSAIQAAQNYCIKIQFVQSICWSNASLLQSRLLDTVMLR